MIRLLLFASLLIGSTLAQNSTWQTLSGDRARVIARGGFSGLFPESSDIAVKIAESVGIKGTVIYCDLQLTKDQVGFCQTELRLDNSTTIALAFPKGQKSYVVNGKPMQGWFGLDFYADELFANVTRKSP